MLTTQQNTKRGESFQVRPFKAQYLNRLYGLFRKRKREIEQDYWEEFANTINFRTTPSQAWKTKRMVQPKLFSQSESQGK